MFLAGARRNLCVRPQLEDAEVAEQF